MRLTLKLKENGDITIGLLISKVIPSISYSLLSAIPKAALRFLNKAIGRNGKPGLVNIDKSGANKAGINQFNIENNRRVKNRQCKYLNNIIEQDHRRVKRLTRSMLGFKSFHSAQTTLAGIELVAMLRKGQMKKNLIGALTPAEQFYALAA